MRPTTLKTSTTMRLLAPRALVEAWDDEDNEEKFDETPQPRGREKAQTHRGGKKPTKAEKAEKPKGKEPNLEDLSTTILAELKRESQEWTATSHPARKSLRKPSLSQVSTQRTMW